MGMKLDPQYHLEGKLPTFNMTIAAEIVKSLNLGDLK